MKFAGFSLLELLFVLSLSAAIYAAAMPSFNYYIYRIDAMLTINQIQHSINYGRSLAIKYQIPVTICPSQDRLTCGGDWKNGILVITPNAPTFFQKVFISKDTCLILSISGFQGSKLVIEANGLTHQNGSFHYKSLKNSGFPQYKLYFNKGLRIYVVDG